MPDTKQAVILVHGMGQQVPMETLRGFIETMWSEDASLNARLPTDPPDQGNPVWWRPDASTGSLELSRITTRHVDGEGRGPRSDFYELYWADTTDGTTLAQLKDWFLKLMWRPREDVPPTVIAIWRFLWGVTMLIALLWGWKEVLPNLIEDYEPPRLVVILAWVMAAIAPVFLAFAVNYFGDVARYTRAAPSNIAARKAARERGLALLRLLSDDPNYDRIVLVGHSLGSILAYDLVKFLWAERVGMRSMIRGTRLHTTWRIIDRAAKSLREAGTPSRLKRYRFAQRRLYEALRDPVRDQRWLISDLVTLGSPLTHAEFLLERNAAAFAKGVAERRFPKSPPVDDPPNGLIYRDVLVQDPRGEVWRAHHATPFAAIRWTNVFDPRRFIFWGDFVSGPVAPLFGAGVVDRPVRMRDRLRGTLFTHTLYWTRSSDDPPQIPVVREALDLGRRR